MAVHIPVVVDIDQAFKEASQRVGVAIEPLRKSVEGLTSDLAAWRDIMRESDIQGDSWLVAAKNIQTITERLAEAEYALRRYTANNGSIKQMSIDLAEVERRWAEMGAKKKFNRSGDLSREAKKLKDEYIQITGQIQKSGQSLAQMLATEQRIAGLKQQQLAKRKYENAILNATTKSMRVLQEQERILSERLGRASIGSNKYALLKTQLQGVRAEIAKLNADIAGKTAPTIAKTNTLLGGTSSHMLSLVKNMARLFAFHAGMSFVKNVREVTAEFELQRVALGSIIRDTEKANELFRQIKVAAIESPFQIKELVTYTKQLAAYGIESNKLFDTMTKLADVSAGLGVEMNRIILAYGQVRAAAVLRGQELRQFTEAGIPLVEKLADKFTKLRHETVSTADVFQLISERAVPFRMIEEIFDDMTSSSGMFYRMQEKQAKTLAGQWSNLKDSMSIMYDEIGRQEGVHDFMEGLIASLRSIISHWRTWANLISVVGGGLVAYYALAAAGRRIAAAETAATIASSAREKGLKRLSLVMFGHTTTLNVMTTATNVYTYATGRAAAASNLLTAAFWRLTAAMAKNPFGLIAIAVGSLISLFISLRKHTHDVTQDIEGMEASIKSLESSRTRTTQLIDDYEKLESQTNRTAQETKNLKEVSETLAKTFPKVVEGVDSTTGALKLNVKKLREYNEQASEAIVKGLERQIEDGERQLYKNQKRINRISNALANDTNNIVFTGGTLYWDESGMKNLDEQLIKLINDNDALAKAIQAAKDAIAGIKDTGDAAASTLTNWQQKMIATTREVNGVTYILTDPDTVKNYSNLESALEDLAKKYKEYQETIDILTAALVGKNAAEAAEISLHLESVKAHQAMTKEILEYYNAMSLTTKKTTTGGGGSRKDPFITLMQNRIKFMQDFKKGYDDLAKYMTQTEALDIESKIMLGRGKSLGLDLKEQARAAEGLSAWYTEMLKKVEDALRAKGMRGLNATDFLSIDTSKKSKAVQELQQLLQQIWDAKTDYDVSQKKKDLEDALKRLSNEIKRSKVARSFFDDILDLTGDKEVAANMTMSIYGDVGDDLETKLKQQLKEAFVLDEKALAKNSLSLAQANADIAEAIMKDDFVMLASYLDYVTDANRDNAHNLLSERMQANADWYKDFRKTYDKAKTYKERINLYNQQRENKKTEAQKHGASDSDLKAIDAYYDKEIAAVKLEELKDTDEWTKAFEDLENVSSETLRNLIALLDEYIKKYGQAATPEALKTVTQSKESAEDQLTARNAYKETSAAIREYITQRKKAAQIEKDGNKNSKAYAQAQDAARKALKKAQKGVAAISESFDNLNSIVSAVSDIMQFDELSSGRAVLEGVAEGISLIGTALTLVNAILTAMESNPIVLAISAIIAGVAALGKVVSNLKMNRIEKGLASQQQAVDNLTHAYDRLEKELGKAFGSDYIYIYNRQLDNLQAQLIAYQRQVELEREKGKKKDEEKIKDYQDSIRDTQEQIQDMQHQLSEFFTDTNLTSAAQDFANAWIEAYKEFGSTTQAIKEKFNEMIQNMVERSLAAKIMQTILSPLFEDIDKMAKDGLLSAQEIAQISADVPGYINTINEAMTNLMNQLGAAGYNTRQQVAGLTGISRNIATASEESILGLAAGINTQNFYISHIDQNVAAILATLTGTSAETAAGTQEAASDPYRNQILTYASSIPGIRDDMAAIRSMLDRVIKPKGVSATAYVAVNM